MPGRTLGLVALAALLAGCELREVSLTQPERQVIAEAYVRVSVRRGLDPRPSPTPLITVFLHHTLGATGTSGPVPGARIVVARPADGLAVTLEPTSLGECVITIPVESTGTCYGVRTLVPQLESLGPGDRLTLRVELADGGVLTSETTIPGRFELQGVRDGTACELPPLTSTDIVWSRSAGAWAYISDTYLFDLGLDTPDRELDDPLYLFGLSISAQDTTIVFPREFGVFARGELDRDVSLLLQQGLPDGSGAIVTISAVDRNWVNWARGGNFNPSGQVRVPSVRGDGTGVFGSAVLRGFRVDVGEDPFSPNLPPCPPDPNPPAIP